MKPKDMRAMPLDELELLHDDTRLSMFKISNSVQMAKKDEKPHRIHQAKKKLARVLTIMHEKRMGIR